MLVMLSSTQQYLVVRLDRTVLSVMLARSLTVVSVEHTDCISCAAEWYVVDPGSAEVTDCLECSVGLYSTVIGKALCRKCRLRVEALDQTGHLYLAHRRFDDALV